MRPVLQITPVLFGAGGYWGGGERYVSELARAQAALTPTRLISIGPQARTWTEGPLTVSVLPERHHYKGDALGGLSERLVAEIAGSRAIHVHQVDTALTSACLMIAAALRRPAFVTDHGGSGPNENRRLRLYRTVRRYLAVSEYSVQFFPALAGRSSVIYAGVDTERYHLPPAGSPRAREAVFIGRIMPHKGVDVLVDAMDADTPLHVYGRPYDTEYLAYVHSRAADKNVHFHHDASDAEVIAALQRARVVVLPTTERTVTGETASRTEYFGLVLAEAMACGTPVVGTRVGGLPEVIDDGVTGRLVAPGDSAALAAGVGDILNAPDARWEAMSRAARARVTADFTWDAVAQRCLDLYGYFSGPAWARRQLRARRASTPA